MTEVRLIKIPAIGQTFSRDLMPQLGDHLEGFLKFLDSNEIDHCEKSDINPASLKATQSNGFDYDKIMSIPPGDVKIITSNDDHVIDGHHRWLAAHNREGIKLHSVCIDLPVLDAVSRAKEYLSTLNIKEGVTRKEFQPMVDSFVDFATSELGIKSFPTIQYKNTDDDNESDHQPSFGGYIPSSKTVVVATKNRHPMDILRTLAHELVHHKQNEDGLLKDLSASGETGSDIENEANSKAGILMRKHGKKSRHLFKMGNLDEQFKKIVEDSPSDREWGTKSLTKTYKKDTPGQNDDEEEELEEDGILDTASGAVGLSKSSDGIGPEAGVSNFGPGGLGSAFSYGSIRESVIKWSKKEETKKKYKDRYGKDSEKKLHEVVNRLQQNIKKIKAIKESMDKGAFDMGTVPKQGKEEVIEESPPVNENPSFRKTKKWERKKWK